jgi:hypothetical protein
MNLEDRIETAILELRNNQMVIKVTILNRIKNCSSNKHFHDNVNRFRLPDLKFKWWNRNKHLQAHVADLNTWMAYETCIKKMESTLKLNQ